MLLPAILALTLLAAPAAAQTLRLVAMGDAPNGPPERSLPLFDAVTAEIAALAPDLVIHIGDLRGGEQPCDDAFYADRRARLDALAAPVLLTPGDNDWTDCWFENGGGRDPAERLAHLRATFFDPPGLSLGARPVAVAHQGAAGFPENVRLALGPVMVVTVHVVGSNNGFELHDPRAAEEVARRDAAAEAWLVAAVAEAQATGAAGLIIALHANMVQDGFDARREAWVRHSGYARVGPAVQRAAAAFGGPVLLIHGDSHQHRTSRPFRRTAPNLLMLEVFGAPDVNGVEILVDPDRPTVFALRPLLPPTPLP